jgi:outer membrane protein
MSRIFIIITTCLAFLSAGSGFAATTSPVAPLLQVRAAQALILQLISAGKYAEALQVAENFEPEHPNHAARVNFVRGMIAQAQGRNRDATKNFRKVLAAQPDLTPARQQLAQSLYRDQDLEAAQHQFEILSSATNDPQLRQLYNTFSAKISEAQPWSLSGYATVAPSTNVNHGSNHNTANLFGLDFNINDEAKKASGVGLAAGVAGAYKFQLGEGVSVTANSSFDGHFYSIHDADVLRLAASLKPGYTSQDRSFSFAFGPTVEMGMQAYNLAVMRYGAAADLSFKLDEGLFYQGQASLLYQDYKNDASRNGTKLEWDSRIVKVINSATRVSFINSILREDVGRNNLDHFDVEFGINLDREWQGGWITGLEPSIGRHFIPA